MDEPKKDVIRETDAEAIRLAKTLLRSARFGALAVIEPQTGSPLASRVGVATDIDGAPLILVSMLSAHTGALLADPRCSLLLGEPGKGDPLAHPRLTLICQAARLERGSAEHARVERRYLNHNPKAKLYAGLGDFSIFRLGPQRASLNGGFGKAYHLDQSDLLTSGPIVEELAAREQSAIDHMNADHLDAIALYAQHFAKVSGNGWRVAGFDADGMDLVSGDDVCRAFYPQPLAAAGELRHVLVDMAKAGRAIVDAGTET
ncbi:MAG: HugZ family protein [Mesorhizobium sp.]|uniref:HugZ family pyridoxamine 5'-phosphate oxidase n=1 Tax=Mesorhizobium sp. TaxID=1871066 RepID=UPI000FE6E2C1|nr:HugZ family protein [Mesorhizobium sp.]RWN21350.1 MAG: HugZ family protein [Mesorhizobium sp.]RWN49259.1 MAG: HugZ family protein [Mesorhizobium sp.]RWO43309.1 MAG: HugZ family protein [Mesorhizobium sp.]TJV26177.1 MAG: HugZ family protein [Mesorhizobium sp.]